MPFSHLTANIHFIKMLNPHSNFPDYVEIPHIANSYVSKALLFVSSALPPSFSLAINSSSVQQYFLLSEVD
jgi:hypothetical protein